MPTRDSNGPHSSRSLTGATRYRSGFRGALVLQVETRHVLYWEGHLSPFSMRRPVYGTAWRDARVSDLTELQFQAQADEAERTGRVPPPPPPMGAPVPRV